MKGRSFQDTEYDSYRFGFNGMEKDGNFNAKGDDFAHYDFGARMYDARLGRWLSRDPLERKYASLSPYNFVANSPLVFVDPDGKKIKYIGTRQFRKTMRNNLKILSKMSVSARIVISELRKSDNVHNIYEVRDREPKKKGSPAYKKALRNYRDFDIGWASYTEYSFAQLEYSTNPAVITDTEKTFFATGFDDKRDSDGTGTGSTLYLALQLFNENGYLNSDGVSSTFWGTLSHELSHMIDAERGVSVAAPEENSRSAEDAAVSFQDIITLEIEEYFNNKGLNVKIPLRNSYDNLVTEGVQALDKKTKKWLDKKKKG